MSVSTGKWDFLSVMTEKLAAPVYSTVEVQRTRLPERYNLCMIEHDALRPADG
jgi:hypothetical protein